MTQIIITVTTDEGLYYVELEYSSYPAISVFITWGPQAVMFINIWRNDNKDLAE